MTPSGCYENKTAEFRGHNDGRREVVFCTLLYTTNGLSTDYSRNNFSKESNTTILTHHGGHRM